MERQERLAQVIDALDEIVLPFKHVGRWALLVEDAPLDEVLEALPYAPEVKVATVGSGVLVAINKAAKDVGEAGKASYNTTTIPDVYRRLQALRYPLRVQGNTVIVDADTNPDELRRVLGDPYNVRIRHEIGRTYLEVQTAAAASLDADKAGFAPGERITFQTVISHLRREGVLARAENEQARSVRIPYPQGQSRGDARFLIQKVERVLNELKLWYTITEFAEHLVVYFDNRMPAKAMQRIELGVKAAVAAKRGMRMSPEEVEGRLQASGLSYRPVGAGVYLVTFNDEQMRADPRSLVPLFPQADNVDIRAQEGGIQVAVKLIKPSAALGQQVFNKLEQHRNNYTVERTGYVRARVSHPSGRLVTVKEIDDLLADMPQLTFVQSGNAVIVNIAPSSPDEHQIIETYPASGRQPGIHVVRQPGSRFRGAWPIASIQKRRRSKKPL